MKIKEYRVFVVENPPPHYGGAYWTFVKLITDSKIEGIGEVYSLPFHPRVVEKMISDICERYVIGHDPFQIEQLWRRVYSSGYSQRSDLSLMGILSGIETACWDINGKALEKPVYELLGGLVHPKLRTYTYLYPDHNDEDRLYNYPEADEKRNVYNDPDLAAEAAVKYADQGFTALKFDPVGPYSVYDPRMLSLESMDRAERFVRQIREAVGNRCDLLFGTHGQMTPESAIRLAKKIEPYDPLWFEEPVPPENLEAMKRVAESTSIPVATGERLATKYEFAQVLQKQAAGILQMALGRVGGLLEAKKIAGMAEAHYALIAPHLYCGPVEGAANIHLDACSPNFLIQEGIEKWDGFHTKILKKPIQWEEGYVIPPSEPGLGIELNEEVALQHPYSGKGLHLEMHPDPILL